MAKQSKGTRIYINNGSDKYLLIGEVESLGGIELAHEMVDTTRLIDDAVRRTPTGIVDNASVTFSAFWEGDDTEHADMLDKLKDGDNATILVAFAPESGLGGSDDAVTVSAADDTIVVSDVTTGSRIVLTGTTAPGGLSFGTIYYVERKDASDIYLHETYTSAVRGVASGRIDITSAGSGVNVHWGQIPCIVGNPITTTEADGDSITHEFPACVQVWVTACLNNAYYISVPAPGQLRFWDTNAEAVSAGGFSASCGDVAGIVYPPLMYQCTGSITNVSVTSQRGDVNRVEFTFTPSGFSQWIK